MIKYSKKQGESAMKLPENVEFILKQLNKHGYEGYIVGGCVRDHLMGMEPHDYDITTSALPEQVKEIFPHTVDTGIQHGTVAVILDRTAYEVTTYRIDGEYRDNRHPEEVIFTDRLSGDLSRRDFTVNAIAYSNEKGFVDLFNGRDDIENKIIRGVGDPDKRFKEDALRMMRALRFSAQLDFGIEENTLSAIRKNAPLIENISAERIREELFRLIGSDHNERLEILKNSGMAEYILPEIFDIAIDFSNINRLSKNIALRLAYMFSAIGERKVKDMLIRLRTDKRTVSLTSLLVKNCERMPEDRYSMRCLINAAEENVPLLIELVCALHGKDIQSVSELYNSVKNDCCTLKDLAVKGSDINSLGIKGKEVGNILNRLLDYVMHCPEKNNKDGLISYAKEIME